ncbi:MAG: ParB N-terminal domain-containing protein [Desulfobacterales bacterium]|nr:ParB N-terminal domain-containing protein [Desulfobacterales bacterium]
MNEIDILKIPVSAIDMTDTGFRITGPDKNIENLVNSVLENGLLVPPLVFANNNSYTIVSGFKRVEAVKQLGWETITCRVLSKREQNDPAILEKAARMAVSENAFTRELQPGELIRAVALLEQYIDHKQIADSSISLFNCDLNSGYLRTLSRLHKMPKQTMDLIDTGHLSIKATKTLLAMDKKSVNSFLDLFSNIKVSSGKQIEIINWANEICARDGIDLPKLLDDTLKALGISQTDQSSLSAHKDLAARGNQLRTHLLQRRYPALEAARKKAAEHLNQLKLGPGIKVSLPVNFESTVYSMQIDFKSVDEFKSRMEKLVSLQNNPDLKGLLDR